MLKDFRQSFQLQLKKKVFFLQFLSLGRSGEQTSTTQGITLMKLTPMIQYLLYKMPLAMYTKYLPKPILYLSNSCL